MDKRARIRAALRGEVVDRIPLSLWRHFHCQDRTPQGLAQVTLEMAGTYDLDLVKITPCGLYAVEDWAGGRVEYPGTDDEPPSLSVPAVREPGAWRRLPLLDPATGALGRELEAIRLVVAGLGGGTPCVMTVFSPLTLAYKLAGAGAIAHLRQHPAAFHAGLEILTESTIRFVRAALAAGVEGFFFATQLASHLWLAPAEYESFGQCYDLAVLEALDAPAFTILHLHGREVFFDLANRYPIDAVSWHDRETWPSLAQARQRTGRAFLTGLDRDLLGSGPLAEIEAQIREAVEQTKGRGLILAPSCVIPTRAPAGHLRAVRDLVRRL